VIQAIDSSSLPSIPVIQTSSADWIIIIYFAGLTFSLLYFIFKISRVFKLINNTKFEKHDDYKIANNHSSTYSFFNFIFLKDKDDEIIVNHELAHASKYHSFDIVFLEIIKSFIWFNPFVYRINHFIQENHEFEADYIAMNQKRIDEIKMAEYLLNYSIKRVTNSVLITNNFFSLTKNRINMLTKHKSTKNLAYVMLIPIFLVIFSAFTFKTYPVYETPEGIRITLDTLVPGYFTEIDSIVVYNPETQKESLQIVKTKMPMDKYLESLNFSGKLSSRIDTIFSFDPKTNKESMVIYKIKYPYELKYIFHKFTWEQQDAIIKHYGNMTKVQ
jgi:hypothetical protein